LNHRTILFFIVPFDRSLEADPSDLQGYETALHFGLTPVWFYGMGLSDWPEREPRPGAGPLGLLPVVFA
jgi:hypothetical protein